MSVRELAHPRDPGTGQVSGGVLSVQTTDSRLLWYGRREAVDPMPRLIAPAEVLRLVRDKGPIGRGALWSLLEERDDRPPISSFVPPRPTSQEKRIDEAVDELIRLGVVAQDAQGFLRATQFLSELQGVLGISLTALVQRQSGFDVAESKKLRTFCRERHATLLSESFGNDLLATLFEIATCLKHSCYIAAISLCGKALEVCLKKRLQAHLDRVDDSWMLGTLLKKLGTIESEQLDPTLNNVANIINVSRILAVHAKRPGQLPTENQTIMVVRATLDVLERTFPN